MAKHTVSPELEPGEFTPEEEEAILSDRRIAELEEQNARLEIKLRVTARALEGHATERDDLREQLEAATAERDGLKRRVSA